MDKMLIQLCYRSVLTHNRSCDKPKAQPVAAALHVAPSVVRPLSSLPVTPSSDTSSPPPLVTCLSDLALCQATLLSHLATNPPPIPVILQPSPPLLTT
jgi:hypothetical protein